MKQLNQNRLQAFGKRRFTEKSVHQFVRSSKRLIGVHKLSLKDDAWRDLILGVKRVREVELKIFLSHK